MDTATRLTTLRSNLPDWTFLTYGSTGAIASYPPAGQWNTDAKAQRALLEHAHIAGVVSGNGLVVTQLRSEPAGSGLHPLALW